MTTTPDQFPCINGCIVEGTENNEEPELMIARHGRFCDKEFKQIKRALDLAPSVVEHVLSLIDAKSGSDDRVDGSREAPLPLNLQAFTDANETYQRLVFWSVLWADELGINAPGPAVRAWRNQAGVIVGLPANIKPSDARYMVGIMSKWLTIHLDNILALNLKNIGEWREDVQDIYRINARWPQKPRARYSDMPCPKQECKGRIAVYPPKEFEDDERIVCERCGQYFPPAQYEHLINVFKQIRAEKNQTTRHLMRKYVT